LLFKAVYPSRVIRNCSKLRLLTYSTMHCYSTYESNAGF